jgi:hypothetical protein
MGSPTKVQNPHHPPQPQNEAPVSKFASAQTKVPPMNVKNGMMKVRVRIQAIALAMLGKKYEIANARITMMMIGIEKLYTAAEQLFTPARDKRIEREVPLLQRSTTPVLIYPSSHALHECLLEGEIKHGR